MINFISYSIDEVVLGLRIGKRMLFLSQYYLLESEASSTIFSSSLLHPHNDNRVLREERWNLKPGNLYSNLMKLIGLLLFFIRHDIIIDIYFKRNSNKTLHVDRDKRLIDNTCDFLDRARRRLETAGQIEHIT